MIDIVRHWIILPECDVYFHEENKTPELIGFKTVADALQYYHKKFANNERYSLDKYSTEIRSFPLLTEKGRYEFAFKVRKGFTPEWRLTEAETRGAPVVCIEGIHADNVLPGFSGGGFSNFAFEEGIIPSRSPLCTLLSVKGNKDFRTTVSRTSLEKGSRIFSNC